MRSLKFFAVLLTVVAAAGCSQDSPTAPAAALLAEGALSSRSAAMCENVRGDLMGNVITVGGLTFTGDLAGAGGLRAAPLLDPKGARGQGAIHLATVHFIATADGMILTQDVGVLAPISPPVYRLNNRYTIAGGTGAYADASGFIHIHAQLNLATGELEGTYHGRICR